MRYVLRAFLVLLVAVTAPLPAGAATDPAGFITELGNKTVDFLREKLPPAEREKRFRALLNEGFDSEAISRFVLGPYWRTANEAQRREFMKLFEDYIVQVYSARFSQYSGETFNVTGSRPESDTATLVSSQINRTGGAPPIRVDWRVMKTSGGFRISDVIVENVSMMLTQRQEFASVIQRNGGQLEALLKLLREKTRGA